MGKPSVSPAAFDIIILREGVSSRTVQVSRIEQAASVSAKLWIDDPSSVDVKITALSVLALHEIVFDPPDRVPPGVPEPPPQTTQVLVEVEQSDGAPLDVEAGQFVKVSFAAQRTSSAFNQAAGSLVILGSTWSPISVPLTFSLGSDVDTTYGATDLVARQGTSVSTTITATLLAGPAVNVTYELNRDAQSLGIGMDPVTLHVPVGKSRTANLTFQVERDCPAGRKFILVFQTGGIARQKMLVLEVEEAPPRPADPALAALVKATREIDAFHKRHGGHAGRFGFPLEPVRLVDGTYSRRHAGGLIKLMANGPRGTETFYCKIRYVGFVCISESDKISGSEEPYFLISAVGSSGTNTIRVGPYDDVDGGESVSSIAEVCGKAHMVTPPVMLGVIGMEHDHGTPEEAEEKVRDKVRGLVNKVEEALASIVGMAPGTHVIPEWMRDIIVGWIPEGIAAVFGMGDDHVGGAGRILFDNKRDLLEWKPLKVLGEFHHNEFNTRITVGQNDGPEGQFELLFNVQLWRDTDEIV